MDNIKCNKSITELVKTRTSIRTYDNTSINKEILNKLNEFITDIKGTFKAKVRFKIINSKEEINGGKLGTYGIIKGATTYIGVAVEEGYMDLEELGYEMEALILYATSLGLGTCWIAGTFKKSEFSKLMDIKKNEIFAAISPIGYRADKKSFLEKIIKFQGRSGRRKDWSELFKLKNFTEPIPINKELGIIEEALENVRLAPSAINKQPWRIIKDENKFHFYKEEKYSSYSKDTGIDNHRIDMGIAMCHFELTCKEHGVDGRFIDSNPELPSTPVDLRYIITWIKK
jgi:nitroreductase